MNLAEEYAKDYFLDGESFVLNNIKRFTDKTANEAVIIRHLVNSDATKHKHLEERIPLPPKPEPPEITPTPSKKSLIGRVLGKKDKPKNKAKPRTKGKK